MALNERHWIAGTVLACAAIAALGLPPAERTRARTSRAEPTKEARRRDRIGTHLRSEMNTLVLLQRRDAILHRLAGMEVGGAPIVLHDERLPAELRNRIEREVERELVGVGGYGGSIRVAVAVLVDTGNVDGAPFDVPRAERPPGWRASYSSPWLDVQYALPAATDGRTCIAIVRVGNRPLEDARDPQRVRELERSVTRQAGRFLGPCAFHAAHGRPGPAIEQWLANTHFAVALRAPAPGVDSLHAGLRVYLSMASDLDPRPRPAVERWLLGIGWTPAHDFLHTDLLRCAAGDRSSCRAALDAPRSDPIHRDSPWLLGDEARRFAGGLALGPSESWLLAGLHDRLGARDFARFWRATLAPDAAFESVTGITLAEATHQWAGATYDTGGRRGWPHPFALAGQLLLAGTLVGAAAARRSLRRSLRVRGSGSVGQATS